MAILSPRSLLAASCAFFLTIHTSQAQSPTTTMVPVTTKIDMNALTSVGCFATGVPLADNGYYRQQSKGICQPVCYSQSLPVMALTSGTNCFCGSLLPPNATQVDDKFCNTPCGGIDIEMCGGNNYWTVYLTGNTRNHIANYDPAVVSSSASTTVTSAPQTIVVTQSPTAEPSSPSSKSSNTNTIGIAVGVVVGIIVVTGVAFGAWAFMRHKRRRDAAEEAKNQLAVDQFVHGGKHSVSNSLGDSRLDPALLAAKRESTGSIMDNADYSRRILQVRNPDGF